MFVEASSRTVQPWGLLPPGAQHQSAHLATHGTVTGTALHCMALHRTALHCTALHRHGTALHCNALHSTARYDTARPCTHSLWLASLLSCSISDLCPQVSQRGLCCDVSSNNVPLSIGYWHIVTWEGELPFLHCRKGHRIQVHRSGKYYVGHILLSYSIFYHWDNPRLCKRQELRWHRLWASSR